jgi:hypothetical protein
MVAYSAKIEPRRGARFSNIAGHALHESSIKARAPKLRAGGTDVGAASMMCARERKSAAAANESMQL